MDLQDAYALYKVNGLQNLNRQQYSVLETWEHFLDSGVTHAPGVESNIVQRLNYLWSVAISL
jgi:hypothetical protein